jgi:hypothetical protein
MKTAICQLKSVSPYSSSKVILETMKNKELAEDFEKRIWRMRLHTTKEGMVYIPPSCFANCIKNAAKYMSIKVPGNKMTTFTKNFESGVMVSDPLMLNIHKDDVEGEMLFVPSNGKPGGGSRVWKCFPLIPEWSGEVTYYILDDIITQPIFEQVLRGSGQFIGVGRFRPRNRGYYGRFGVEDVKWTEM